MRILLVGGGGREHAMAWKMDSSPMCEQLYCAPGNAGTAQVATNVDISDTDVPALVAFAIDNSIDMVVVGGEEPLAAGLVDEVRATGIKAFGPTREAAQLEANKAFSKELMREASIPTAEARVFTDFLAAKDYVLSREQGVVVKAAGLAKGKGAIVCPEPYQAVKPLEDMMVTKVFGDAGNTVLVEELLTGPEASVLAFCDGKSIFILEPAQDHKPIGEGDTGANTGGMGCYSPVPAVDAGIEDRIEREIIVPVVDALRRRVGRYEGVLYAGVMLTPAGPKVIEFNARFGDPEAQPVLMRMKCDLVEVMLAVCEHRLDGVSIEWDPRPAVCVVMASGGYPGDYTKGFEIHGVDEADAMDDVKVFHAGTTLVDGKLVTNGGRVLGVTALGDTIAEAKARAYEAVGKITWTDCYFRRDIADKAIT
jgi:phosphoribosylamine--glycine ligase